MLVITALSYLLAVARNGSVTRAAEELYISQPALSAAIIRLENRLNVKLIERGAGGVRLTAEGECAVKYASEICSAYDKLQTELRMLGSKSHGVLRLGSGMRHAVSIADGFLYKYPSENVLLTQYNSYYELKRALLASEIDLCVSAPPVEGGTVRVRNMCTERLCAAFGRGHPFAGRSEVSLREVVDSKLLALPGGFSLRVVIDDAFKRAGLTPRYTIQAENSALADLLHSSRSMDYVAIYPLSRCRELAAAYPEILYCPIAGDATRTIAASWLDKTPLTPQFELMIEYLEEYYSNKKYSLK